MSLRRQAFKAIGNQHAHTDKNAFVNQVKKDIKEKNSLLNNESIGKETPSTIERQLIALKDNICTIGEPTTCASAILRNYKSPYAATVVQKLQAAGALIVGKTNLDEFGMGSHSIHSVHGRVKSHLGNSEDPYSAGGSSGGSAIAVATMQCWAALGTDTGGSVRLPAAYTGIVGFKPSYGTVSRWGVVAYANSLDAVGVLARSAKAARQVFDTIKGYDSNDPTSVPTLIQNPHKRQTLLRIGVPREYMIKELDSTMRQAWLTILLRLQSRNHTIQEISLPTTQAALSAYYIIAPAEASSNLAKYDGVRFGSRSDDQDNEDHPYAPTRGNGLGKEVRRRILLGSYSLSAAAKDSYFLKAQKVRRLVQRDFNQVFVQAHPLIETETDVDHTNGVDIIITPTAPTFPPTQSSLANAAAVDAYRDDVFTVPASLAGLPAINLPVALGTPKGEFALKTAGMQIIGQYGSDDFLLDVAEEIENLDQQDL